MIVGGKRSADLIKRSRHRPSHLLFLEAEKSDIVVKVLNDAPGVRPFLGLRLMLELGRENRELFLQLSL
ncbi:MAG TPA: hypothetical protein VF086_16005 [Propionibacteriaceae bacterium]